VRRRQGAGAPEEDQNDDGGNAYRRPEPPTEVSRRNAEHDGAGHQGGDEKGELDGEVVQQLHAGSIDRPAMRMPSYAEELASLSNAAESGDVEAGERLFHLFAGLADDPDGAHPELVRHVARCLRRLMDHPIKDRANAAMKELCVLRPKHRPPDSVPNPRKVEALTVYFAARASGERAADAIAKGAEAGAISDETMKDLTRSKKKTSQAVMEQFAALLHLSEEQRNVLAAMVGRSRD
jgi:hypothetical protein